MKCLPFNSKKMFFEDTLRYQWYDNEDNWCSFNDQPSYVECDSKLIWEKGRYKFRGYGKPSIVYLDLNEIRFYNKDEFSYIPDNIHPDYLNKGFFAQYTSDGKLYKV